MPSIVPKQGIQAYMDAQALALTPANLSWKIWQWFTTGPGSFLIIGAIIIGVTAPSFGPLASDLSQRAVMLIPIVLVVALVLKFSQRPPGRWRRYSIFVVGERYPELGVRVDPYVCNIRKDDPGAEFEFAILECKKMPMGAVLFKVSGKSLSSEGEQVVQIFTEKCTPLVFGEGYALPAVS